MTPTEYASAFAVALRDQEATVGKRVAVDPRSAHQPGTPDTLRLAHDLIDALRARPEVARVCVPEQPGPDLAPYCDPHDGKSTVRYAVSFSTPLAIARDTVEFSASFVRLETTAFSPAFAFGLHYRVARNKTSWVVVERRDTFIT